MRKKELFKTVLDYFQQTMSDTETELDYGTTFQLLVAVVLSAQCTDKRVNLITPKPVSYTHLRAHEKRW